MMVPRDNPLVVDIEPTVGAWFIGAIASVGLTGITTLQSWLYFQKYPQDPISYKLLVAFTWTIEIIRSCIAVHGGYYYSVQKWGNVPALFEPVWSMKALIFVTHLVELAVHLFFVHKVWRVSRGRAKVLCIITVLFILSDFALGLVSYITAMLETDVVQIIKGTSGHAAMAAVGCAIGSDWLITFALVRFFRENKTEFHRTNHTLNKLMFYAINMGLLISITDTIILVLAIVPWASLNFYQLAVYEVVGNIYANSLLACLNTRSELSQSSLHSSPGDVGTGQDSLNHTGRIQIQFSQQTWTSSGPEVSLPTPESKPQAATFAHTIHPHPVDSG